MKEYLKPEIKEEEIELEDIIATSPTEDEKQIASPWAGDNPVSDFFG